MKKIILLMIAVLTVSTFTGCNQENTKPEEHHIKNIAELATMECYYHAVEKYDNSKGFLWFGQDAKFFAEAEVIVNVGIAADEILIESTGTHFKITLPPATVQSESTRVNGDVTFYVDKVARDATAEVQQEARAAMIKKVENIAATDEVLLLNAQERAKILLENYIYNLGESLETEYTIEWILLEPEIENKEIQDDISILDASIKENESDTQSLKETITDAAIDAIVN